MRWFFVTFYAATTVLFLCFVAWIITRVMHADQANYIVGRVMIYDLYVLGVIAAYTAFVGAWHTWEKLTGRMEAEAAATPEGPPGDEQSPGRPG